jgi:hypothetical protein
MAFNPSIAIVFLLVIIGSFAIKFEQKTPDAIVHDGQCPSNNLLGHIHCRRRVCLPEELIPQCKGDGDCLTTQKCCRPMCSCRVQCVEAQFSP